MASFTKPQMTLVPTTLIGPRQAAADGYTGMSAVRVRQCDTCADSLQTMTLDWYCTDWYMLHLSLARSEKTLSITPCQKPNTPVAMWQCGKV
jgi:hypothetical protein